MTGVQTCALPISIVAVYALVKVNRVNKELEQTQLSMSRDFENTYRQIHEEARFIYKRVEEVEKDILSLMDSRFDKLQNKKQLLKD